MLAQIQIGDQFRYLGNNPPTPPPLPPKPTFCPKREVSDYVDLREGWVVSSQIGPIQE